MKWLLGSLLGAVACAAACANGGADGTYVGNGQPGLGDDASLEAGSVDGSHASSGSGSGSSSSGSSSGSSGSSGGGVDAGGDDGGAESGSGSGGGSGSGSGSSGGSCSASNTCTNATSIGTFGGDVSGATLMATGTTSDWMVVAATEQDSSPLGVPMKLTASLTSPAGSNFDLYAYLGTKGAWQCTTVQTSSTSGTGQVDTLSFSWGEMGTLANGADDSANVVLEVRYVSGPCTSSDTWTLSTHGH